MFIVFEVFCVVFDVGFEMIDGVGVVFLVVWLDCCFMVWKCLVLKLLWYLKGVGVGILLFIGVC